MYNIYGFNKTFMKELACTCVMVDCHVGCRIDLKHSKYKIWHVRDAGRTRKKIKCTTAMHTLFVALYRKLWCIVYIYSHCIRCEQYNHYKNVFLRNGGSIAIVACRHWFIAQDAKRNIRIIFLFSDMYYPMQASFDAILGSPSHVIKVNAETFLNDKRQKYILQQDPMFDTELCDFTVEERNCMQHQFEIGDVLKIVHEHCTRCFKSTKHTMIKQGTIRLFHPIVLVQDQYPVYMLNNSYYCGYVAHYDLSMDPSIPFITPWIDRKDDQEILLHTILYQQPLKTTLCRHCTALTETIPLAVQFSSPTDNTSVLASPEHYNRRHTEATLSVDPEDTVPCDECQTEYNIRRMYWIHQKNDTFYDLFESSGNKMYLYVCEECIRPCRCGSLLPIAYKQDMCRQCRLADIANSVHSTSITHNPLLQLHTDCLRKF